MRTAERPRTSEPVRDDAQVLFPQAKRRERRRRLSWLSVVVVVAGVVAASLATTGSSPRSVPAGRTIHSPVPMEAVGLPTGPVVGLDLAGALAVGPSGALFVVDQHRHQVLVRLADGRFRVVAGDGGDGFGGDGGPATKAELSTVSDITFAPNGDLYLADGGRVRVVDRDGTIRTVVGRGGPASPVADGTPPLAAALGSPISIAFGPGGELYVASSSQILRLTSADLLDTVPAVIPDGPTKGPLEGLQNIAVDARGNVDVSGGDGWSVYQVGPDGVATYLGYARRSGGAQAVLELGPGGVVEADDGSNILGIEGNRLVTRFTFDGLPHTSHFTFLSYFAYAPHGALYADDIGLSAFGPTQEIVTVVDGHAAVLWRHWDRT
jgi:hypothetical protein